MIIYIHIQSCIHGKARATRIFDKSPNLLISPAIKPTGMWLFPNIGYPKIAWLP